ncbi:hypothetical protein NPIL_304641 [Nephila pilipes]|uniref:Uncharacterized protein n=1 Tax=Nephila pilipes TaxID=299642 RepID=A0A8X6N5P6_NEPPI|nr:hypothetical protein NPIL_304641 [Nephila pilipes]
MWIRLKLQKLLFGNEEWITFTVFSNHVQRPCRRDYICFSNVSREKIHLLRKTRLIRLMLSWRMTLRGFVCSREKISCPMWWISCEPHQKMCSISSSDRGKIAGRSAWEPKERERKFVKYHCITDCQFFRNRGQIE